MNDFRRVGSVVLPLGCFCFCCAGARIGWAGSSDGFRTRRRTSWPKGGVVLSLFKLVDMSLGQDESEYNNGDKMYVKASSDVALAFLGYVSWQERWESKLG